MSSLIQVFSSEADLLTRVLDGLKTSSHYAQNSAAVNELSKQIADTKIQLESWRRSLNEAGALETIMVNASLKFCNQFY